MVVAICVIGDAIDTIRGTTTGVRAFLRDERAVALLDMMVGCALIATIAAVLSTVYGLRPARAHAAAMSLEMALSEARTLAAANANVLDPLYPTGAMVVIESDPAAAGDSRIAVYRSRPVVINGKQPFAPVRDSGFPALRVAASYRFAGANLLPNGRHQQVSVSEPFAIMFSGGGYASIVQLTAPYDETNPTLYSQDPGCAAESARIIILDGSSTETHDFGCTGGAFHAS